jgi:tetratricopeptide (TPR) repeat protein
MLASNFLSMHSNQQNYGQNLLLKLLIGTIFWLCISTGAIAASKKAPPAAFPVNPLEIKTPDPLLPSPSPTPAEQKKLSVALDELNNQAQAKLKAGDKIGAFEIWNRELRLRRVLGFLPETQALARVGAIAWTENERYQVQVITQRLDAISLQLKSSNDLPLLTALASAFEQVRVPKSALAVYTQILAIQQKQDSVAAEETLQTIAELHLSWFDYPQAVASYNQLLTLAKAKADRPRELAYLQQLAYIYDQSKQRPQAIETKQQLLALYQQENLLTAIPALHLAIANDYEGLGQLEQAFASYQQAYTSAWALQQFFQAGDALRKLVALYNSQGQIDEALQTSRILLQADEQAVNIYGMMNTYDQIGQINIKRGNYSEALAAFQNGLELAKQLQYQEDYFTQQIALTNKQVPK